MIVGIEFALSGNLLGIAAFNRVMGRAAPVVAGYAVEARVLTMSVSVRFRALRASLTTAHLYTQLGVSIRYLPDHRSIHWRVPLRSIWSSAHPRSWRLLHPTSERRR